MRPTNRLTAAILAVLVGIPARANAAAAAAAPEKVVDQRAAWIGQARSADAIGEVLMAAGERAEARVDLLRRKLAEAGERPVPATGASATTSPATAAAAAAARQTQSAHRELFDRVMAELRRASANQIDPSLQNLTDDQLFAEMAALQSFNLRTFRRLDDLRVEASEIRARLESIGQWKGAPTTQPAVESPQQLARDAIAALNRPQRSPRWAEARQKMRNALAAARAQQLRNRLPQPSSPPTAYAPPASGVVIDDPRWQPYYYGPGDATGWGDPNDMFADPFDFRGGGGVYERYDTRVNADFDTRTRGQFDRRVNVESDRRLNLHVDPRENF